MTPSSESSSPRRLLFVCSQNLLRSPTAEKVFSGRPGLEVKSAGTDRDATVPLTDELIAWADIIAVMEAAHRNRVRRKFREALAGKRLVVLGIPDAFDYMEPALVEILKVRVPMIVGD